MVANNIANASTAGFKKDSEFYGVYQQAEAERWGDDNMLPVVEKNWTDYSQGTLQPTGNHLDFAISGKGWFALQGSAGPLYTRNGGFHVNSTGGVVSQEGLPVRLAGGNPLRIRPDVPVIVGGDGTLTQGGLALGKLEVVEFPDNALVKQGNTLFRPTDPSVTGKPAGPETEVQQGKLEGANVSSAESAVRLVSLTRQFEALQRAITLGAEMSRKAIEEVARV